MVPVPIPQKMRGTKTTTWFFVNERGALVADSLRLSGFVDQDYERKSRASAEDFRFRPAVYRPMACAIRGWYRLTFQY